MHIELICWALVYILGNAPQLINFDISALRDPRRAASAAASGEEVRAEMLE